MTIQKMILTAGTALSALFLVGCLSGSGSLSVSVSSATSAQCSGGGTLVQDFMDANGNGTLDSGEQVLSTSLICNGANGTNGANGVNGAVGATGSQGVGAGILVTTAPTSSCPVGGSLLTTYVDTNNNGVLDSGEQVTSISTLCDGMNGTNGTNGTDGSSAHITTTAASLTQCINGGAVYSTYTGDQAPVQTIVCNGTNGTNASIEMGAVGPAVAGQPYSACHHDYIYIPGSSTARGWLIFRHQENGAADQGIGSTGFDVWDVDISDFLLVSEVGGVTYCSLHWDSGSKILSYSVVDNSNGLAGAHGTISL